MNLGGTEKSFLNLLSELQDHYTVDLLLLEEYGELLKDIPENVHTYTLKNKKEINEFLKLGNRRFAFKELQRGRVSSFFKNMIVWLLLKFNILKHPFYGVSRYIKNLEQSYDHAVAFAGVHDFIAYYTLNNIKAEKKHLWIHFDVSNVIFNIDFGAKHYPRYNNIICVSENAAKTFAKLFPNLTSNIKVFENIVSSDLLLEKANKMRGFTDDFKGYRIVTLGRLSKEKGQFMIPKVVAKLKNEGYDFRWYLIGDGNLKQAIRQEIIELNIERNLILLGVQLNPYPFLKEADLYVQTSLHEGYCITLHEAKIFNKPVVTTNFLSASNLIVDGEDGLITDISEEGIYRGVHRLLSDKALMKKFSRSVCVKEGAQEKIDDLFKI